LFLADLGGSEQVKKSQVEAGNSRLGVEANFSVGFEMHDRMREAVYINLGLLALKKCIEALNNGAAYVPYQDSKLTMLLSTGLGGDSKTSVIVCGNMDPKHASETMATMRFGERCAMIETEARNNANMLAGVLADLDNQIKALEEAIKQKERWEMRYVFYTHRHHLINCISCVVFSLWPLTSGLLCVYLYPPVLVRSRERISSLRRARLKPLRDASKSRKSPCSSAPKQNENSSSACCSAGQFTGQTLDEMPTEGVHKNKSKGKVIGFGKQFAETYGIGEKYDADAELHEDNKRFAETADEEELPAVIRARAERLGQRRGKSVRLQWTSGSALESDPKKLEERAKKANRGKLVYAGISA
jgi:hypothetical protein